MGSRGRSIRLRIYFLVAIPLITMLGLFGYVAYTSITNYQNLDRAPGLINATSKPLTQFVSLLQYERRAAVVYLSHPGGISLDAYKAAVQATLNGELALEGTVNSRATKDNTTPAETAAINAMVTQVMGMTTLQSAVAGKKIPAIAAFAAYTKIITGQDAVFQAETSSMTQTVASAQGLGLISAVNAREDLSEQDALLAGALAAGSLTGQQRVAFSQAAGRQADDTLLFQALFSAPELRIYNTVMNAQAPLPLQASLAQTQQGVEAGLPLSALELGGLTPASWHQLTKTWQTANFRAATGSANIALAVDQSLADNARNRVWETAAVGAAGLILTLLVTVLLARSINRRLTLLRRSALTLAKEQLPAVVARLRRGESVDVAAEAPPVLVGNDEIGQVGQAIDAVRQTAIRSAVEEARVRQGVNDMFRNLARRSQSLLQRQLTVLDEMERRATDPDVLEDLFKMDHLTTRMRRHAEGLIILSGAAPGRSWSAPVKLIDVMRGAVAEVEDYARVAVSSQSRAALSGSAVTDVTHLLAELIENSTTLSPPFTQVRVAGESVAHGFAIEIEDRGLGMSPQRLAELNERLANPPDLNPANTEQLGLFVVGQLARRHGLGVTLRPSPYGGITAIVLIPRTLIVEEGPAAITTGGPEAVGAGSYGAHPAGAPAGAYAGAAAGGPGPIVPPATPAGGNDWRGANGWSKSKGWTGANDWSVLNGSSAGAGASDQHRPNGPGSANGFNDRSGPGGSTDSIRISGALRHPGTTPSGLGATAANRMPPPSGLSEAGPPRAARPGADDVLVVTDMPVTRPAGAPGAPGALRAPFDVFTPIRRAGPGGAQPGSPADNPYPRSYPDFGAQPSAAPGAGFANGPGTGDPGPVDLGPGERDPGDLGPSDLGPGDLANLGAADSGPDGPVSADDDYKGLPRRVRQASLAPELRASAAATSGGAGPDVPRASAESLSVMRSTLSAMQRGWQQGRSQSPGETEGNADGDR